MSKKFTQSVKGAIGDYYNVDVVTGESIRVYGNMASYQANGEPVTFDITFKVGETAEWGDREVYYPGIITGIGEKTVTIQPEYCPVQKRLSFFEFSWRNYDIDTA